MYDIECLRNDLINFLGSGMNVYPAIVYEMDIVAKATDEEVMNIAINYGINIENYKINNKSR